MSASLTHRGSLKSALRAGLKTHQRLHTRGIHLLGVPDRGNLSDALLKEVLDLGTDDLRDRLCTLDDTDPGYHLGFARLRDPTSGVPGHRVGIGHQAAVQVLLVGIANLPSKGSGGRKRVGRPRQDYDQLPGRRAGVNEAALVSPLGVTLRDHLRRSDRTGGLPCLGTGKGHSELEGDAVHRGGRPQGERASGDVRDVGVMGLASARYDRNGDRVLLRQVEADRSVERYGPGQLRTGYGASGGRGQDFGRCDYRSSDDPQ